MLELQRNTVLDCFEFVRMLTRLTPVGPLSRVGPNDIVVNDAAEWRRILSVRSPYKRSDWYVGMRFDPAKENIESERDEVKYAALRSKMAAGVSLFCHWIGNGLNNHFIVLWKRNRTSRGIDRSKHLGLRQAYREVCPRER